MAALLFGSAGGLGIYLIVRGLVPAGPALGAAIGRLHPKPPVPGVRLHSLADRTLLLLRVTPPVAELRLIGQSVERYVIEKVGYAFVGLLFPALMSELVGAFGYHLPWVVPTVASIGCAIGMFVLADSSVRQKAAAAREEFRRAVATYLTLVGLVRYAGAGAVESLEQAARIGDGWVFERIQQALEDARYANEAPWTRLREVAAEIGVPDLGEVGDIMSLVGDQGAQVYQTLLSRAQSMRTALRTTEQQRAAVATTLLYIPTSLLLLVFIVLIGYPALSRVMG
jgi:hypothetical protein